MLMPTRDNTALCGGCILPTRNHSDAGGAAVLGTSSSPMMSTRGGRGGDSHKYRRFLLSFSDFELSCHLRQVDAKREDAADGLLELLYNRVDVGVSRSYMVRIFIYMGDDNRGRVGGVGVQLGWVGLICSKF